MLLSFLFVCGTASYAQDPSGSSSPSDACLAFKSGLSLGAPLPYTKAKLHAGETLTIVALGSSSTTGFGAFRSGGAFPDVMKQELLRLRPSARIRLINSGRIMDDLPGNIARLENDVLRHAHSNTCVGLLAIYGTPPGFEVKPSPRYSSQKECEAALNRVEAALKKAYPDRYPLVGSCEEFR